MYGELPTLPPQEYWLAPSLTKQSIATPLDARGLVDMDATVNSARSFIDPSFQWESPMNDVHHLHWSISTQMPDGMTEDEVRTLRQFRELVNRKVFEPRVLHNWQHWLMQPPPIPSAEVMRYSIDAQRVALSLAQTASLATRLTRMKAISEHSRAQRLEEEFINYNLYMENARLVPMEFRVVKLEEVEAQKPEDLISISRHLGRMAIGAIPMRVRSVRPAA